MAQSVQNCQETVPPIDSKLGNWLKCNASWNNKKSRAVTDIFSIASSFLCSLSSVGDNTAGSSSDLPTVFTGITISPQVLDQDRGLTCRGCSLTFSNRSEQLIHFKSDLHRVNLKRKLAGLPPVREVGSSDETTVMKRDEEDEKSEASDSSDDEDGDRKEEAPELLLGEDELLEDEVVSNTSSSSTADRASDLVEFRCPEGLVRKQFSKTDGPQYAFSPTLDTHWDFTVSVAALHGRSVTHQLRDGEIQPWQLLTKCLTSCQDKSASMHCIIMLQSGRFAGAIFDGHEVLAHKSFRRYTIRAKAGGSQSAHDSQGRKAKSAGAMLRRYGEQALREDMRSVLQEWSAHLQSCSAIYLSCAKSMRNVLFEESVASCVGGKDAPLRRDDPRVRVVPFMTGKPTFDEVKVIHTRITSIVFYPRGSLTPQGESGEKESSDDVILSKAAEKDHSSSGTSSSAKTKQQAEPQVNFPVLPDCPPSRELFTACRSGDLSRVKAIIQALQGSNDGENASDDEEEEENGETVVRSSSSSSSEWRLEDVLIIPEDVEGMLTCLHVASDLGHTDIVYYLLCKGADPTRQDVRGRYPYFLAKTKPVRDAFRRARARAEERWQWDAVGVPAALTEDAEMLKKEKEREKKKRAKQNKKDKKEKDAQEAAELLKRQEELRLKAIEEEKMREKNAGGCALCGKSLFKVKVHDVFDRRCCSAECVVGLRRRLAAEAAEKRFGGGAK